MTGWEWLSVLADAATVVTGAAVVFAVFPFFHNRKVRRREADQWYVERYWALQDRKRPVQRRSGKVEVIVPFEVRWAELRLCEDELDARADGWVTNVSWAVWRGSILAHRADPEMMRIIDRTPATELTRLRHFLDDDLDPIAIRWWRQFWRGLT